MYPVSGTRDSNETRKQADAWSEHQKNSARKHGLHFIYTLFSISDSKLLIAAEQIQENFTENVYVEYR
jgi:hypothetical protein